ncbi:MAG: peptidase P60 [Pseudomonadota bacterium]
MTDRLFWTEQEHRQAIVDEAVAWIGTPYSHQASLQGVGCDCLGLVRGVWRKVYGEEPEAAPPYTQDLDEALDAGHLQRAAHRHFEVTDVIANGTLVLLRWHPSLPAKHLGIVETAGQAGASPAFIHAHNHIGVCRARLEGAWTRRMAGLFDFPIPSKTTLPNDGEEN